MKASQRQGPHQPFPSPNAIFFRISPLIRIDSFIHSISLSSHPIPLSHFHHPSFIPSTMPTSDRPTVLIVGAGLGGLFLGALLEKANVPYTIFERAAVVKPLGTLGRQGEWITLYSHIQCNQYSIFFSHLSVRARLGYDCWSRATPHLPTAGNL